MKKRRYRLFAVAVLSVLLLLALTLGVNAQAQDGWQEIDGNWYYYENGEPVTQRWITDANGKRYVSTDGIMCVDTIVHLEDGSYMVDENGYAIVDDRIEKHGNIYYTDAQGKLYSNRWVKDSNGWVYAGEYFNILTNEFVEDSNGLCYVDENGYMVKNTWVWHYIDDENYGYLFFNSKGYVAKNKWCNGPVYSNVDPVWGYAGENGYAVTEKWIKDSKGWCYVDGSGFLVTNSMVPDTKGMCWVDKNGYTLKNAWVWPYEDDENTCMWIDGSGRIAYYDSEGWVYDGTGWAFIEYGYRIMTTGAVGIYDAQTDTYTSYYLDENYYRATGWIYSDEHSYWCYAYEDGELAKDKWIKDSKGWCYLDLGGVMVVDSFIQDSKGWCYVDKTGHTYKNTWFTPDGYSEDMVMWADKNGRIPGFNTSDVHWIHDGNGWAYTFCGYRQLEAGFAYDYDEQMNITAYYIIKPNGYMATGWVKFDGIWYYAAPTSGKLVTDKWVKDSKGWCYLDENGMMLTDSFVEDSKGWCYVDKSGHTLKSTWHLLDENHPETAIWIDENGRVPGWNVDEYLVVDDGKGMALTRAGYRVYSSFAYVETNDNWLPIYYSKADGYIATGWYFLEQEEIWIHANEEGVLSVDAWVKDSKGWNYLDESGYRVTDYMLYEYDEEGELAEMYYIGKDGYMVTGWFDDFGGAMYAASNGKIARNKWVKDSVGWRYMDEYGNVTYYSLVADAKGMCFLNGEGYMITNERIYDGGGVYAFDANGHMIKNKWYKIYGEWNYYGKDGYAVTEQWVKDSKGWLYLDEGGYILTEAWLAEEDVITYYVGEDGYRYANGTYTIGGNEYTFDKDGLLISEPPRLD